MYKLFLTNSGYLLCNIYSKLTLKTDKVIWLINLHKPTNVDLNPKYNSNCTRNRRAFHRASRNNPCYLTAVNAPTFVLKNTLMGQCWEEGDEGYKNSFVIY